MQIDLWELYRLMLASRLFEEAVARLWYAGRISGEMHLGTGEEAIVAGVVVQMQDGDAMALDHRGTSPLLMRGVDPVRLLREFLGYPDGLCSGAGGHMHLFSREYLAASSGIVGASGPAAAGFALAAQRLRPGSLAVAFFGEGATNQGMLLESMNLALAWKLPVLFICKDNQWALLTDSGDVIRERIVERARGFGMLAVEVDGSDVQAVWMAVKEGMDQARRGHGPAFVHAHCVHLEGHFLGDPYLRFVRQPMRQLRQFSGPLTRAALTPGGLPLRQRMGELRIILSLIAKAARMQTSKRMDPIARARSELCSDRTRLESLEVEVKREIQQAVEAALGEGKVSR